MARTKISEFSSTPGNNTDIDGINIAENCPPSGINDAIRELMAQLKDFQAGTAGDSFNGPVGTSTAAAGTFTTLSASSTATLNTLASSGATLTGGSINNMAIGGTTAAAASVTTLTTSSTVTHNGGTANGVAYLNGSKVLTSGSALTFDGTNLGLGTASPSGASGTTFAINGGAGQTRLALKNNNSGDASSDGFQIALLSDGVNVVYQNRESGYQSWELAGSEQMRLTSTGLGIGTSSPATRLHVNTVAAGYGVTIAASSQTSITYQLGIDSNSNLAIYDTNAAAQRLVLSNSGNLGLGVTPSAWATYVSLDLPNAGSYISGGTSWMEVMQNTYYNAGYKYKGNGYASHYLQQSGAHFWYTAPSGTAGNAISFTQAATLTAAGEWLVGATSTVNAAKAVFSFNSSNNGVYIIDSTGVSGAQFMRFDSTSGTCGSITRVGTTSAVLYNTSSDYRLKNINGPLTNSGAYIDSLNPVEGTWKADGSTFVGLIAHEVQEASRTTVVTGKKDGEEMQAMDYSSSEIIANMIAELKSLRARVAQLESN